jgi:hypothetical protein
VSPNNEQPGPKFLTLPKEIRQAILSRTFDPYKHRPWSAFDWQLQVVHMHKMISKVRLVNSIWEEDIVFVAEQLWAKGLRDVCVEQIMGLDDEIAFWLKIWDKEGGNGLFHMAVHSLRMLENRDIKRNQWMAALEEFDLAHGFRVMCGCEADF